MFALTFELQLAGLGYRTKFPSSIIPQRNLQFGATSLLAKKTPVAMLLLEQASVNFSIVHVPFIDYGSVQTCTPLYH